MNAPEEWRPVVDWPEYQVSSLGRVRSLDRITRAGTGTRLMRGRVLRQAAGKDGRPYVSLCRHPQQYTAKVCWLVARAWHGPCPQGRQALHGDGNPANNTPGNLRWGTPAENMADCVAHGKHRYASAIKCRWGHRFEGSNLFVRPRPNRSSERRCVSCHLARGYVQWHPDMKSRFAEVADRYYQQVMAGESA